MKQEQFTSKQQAVITALSNQHLTSTELLNKAEKVPHILKLYSILDELRSKGIVDSYIKEGVKYHYAA
jgi:Fe2+ or Zn2+ uptake regulation protein